MTFKGTIRGGMIQLSEPLPFADGQRVSISIVPDEATDESEPRFGSPQALLRAIRRPPHVDPAIVDEMERAIEEGKLPVRYGGVFDDDADQ